MNSFIVTAVTMNFVVTVIVTTKLAVTFIICFTFPDTGTTELNKKEECLILRCDDETQSKVEEN